MPKRDFGGPLDVARGRVRRKGGEGVPWGRRGRRRRTNVNPRVINDIEINPPSKLPPHRPLQRFMSTEEIASLEDN
eukprot:1842073-Pyramimonas_sp.AAC.1